MTADIFKFHWDLLIGRWNGPLAFRLILQPAVAAILGLRAGIRDARSGDRPYGWRFLTGHGRRVELAREGWDHIGKLFCVAVVIDLIYQLVVFRRVYVSQLALVASFLALPAYLLARGSSNRLFSRLHDRSTGRSLRRP